MCPWGGLLCVCVFTWTGYKPLSGSQGSCDPTKLGPEPLPFALLLFPRPSASFSFQTLMESRSQSPPSSPVSPASTLASPASTWQAPPPPSSEHRLSQHCFHDLVIVSSCAASPPGLAGKLSQGGAKFDSLWVPSTCHRAGSQ